MGFFFPCTHLCEGEYYNPTRIIQKDLIITTGGFGVGFLLLYFCCCFLLLILPCQLFCFSLQKYDSILVVTFQYALFSNTSTKLIIWKYQTLPVLRDDTEHKQEAACRASEVSTLTVQWHRRSCGLVFEACSSVQHRYSLNTVQRYRKTAFSFSLCEQTEYRGSHFPMAFPHRL